MDFSAGLSGWQKTGTAFDTQPTVGDNVFASRVGFGRVGGDYTQVPYPTGANGRNWIGTFENHPTTNTPIGTTQGDGPTGALTSLPFKVSTPYLSFLIAGGNKLNEENVQLEVSDGGAFHPTFFLATGRNSEVMRREVWQLAPVLGKQARLVIHDLSSAPWGHISVADFRFGTQDPRPHLATMLISGVDSFIDPETPVFGLADLHSHPAANLGFGGNLYEGSSRGPIATALGSCAPNHDTDVHNLHPGAQSPTGQAFEDLGLGLAVTTILVGGNADVAKSMVYGLEGSLHSGAPFPALQNYRYTNQLHQHMHWEWIKRAYDGGLRLLVAHAVSNQSLALIDPKANRGLLSDKAAADAQILEIQRMVAEHLDFMQIATDPAMARSIIRSGRLAVVLGIEVDQIGDFNERNRPGPGALEAEIRRLQGEGVRHIFPVHLANSAVGGCSIYGDFFNINNFLINGDFFNITNGASQGVAFRLLDLPTNIPIPNVNLSLNNGSTLSLQSAASAYLPHLRQYNSFMSHLNAQGLQQGGDSAVQQMMNLGMIIDVDHMSQATTDGVLSLAEAQQRGGERGYPISSGHCDFRALSFLRGERPGDTHLTHESQKSDATARRILALGGMLAPISEAMDVKHDPGCPVLNDAPGTSKSWAQELHHAIELSGGRGVGIGTDMALLGGFGPRFGTDASPLETLPDGITAMFSGVTDDQRDAKAVQRRTQVAGQTNGVIYDAPISDYRRYRFYQTNPNTPRPVYTERQRDLWEGLAIADSRTDPKTADQPTVREDRSLNTAAVVIAFAEGAEATNPATLVRPVGIVGNGEYFAERRTAFLLFHPEQFGHGPGTSNGTEDPGLVQCLRDVTEAFRSWQAMKGIGSNRPANNPIRKLVYSGVVNGKPYTRDFDINIDGFAHYGMLPDALQDLKNDGLTQFHFESLFKSAEEYIRMWEKCERVR